MLEAQIKTYVPRLCTTVGTALVYTHKKRAIYLKRTFIKFFPTALLAPSYTQDLMSAFFPSKLFACIRERPFLCVCM